MNLFCDGSYATFPNPVLAQLSLSQALTKGLTTSARRTLFPHPAQISVDASLIPRAKNLSDVHWNPKVHALFKAPKMLASYAATRRSVLIAALLHCEVLDAMTAAFVPSWPLPRYINMPGSTLERPKQIKRPTFDNFAELMNPKGPQFMRSTQFEPFGENPTARKVREELARVVL